MNEEVRNALDIRPDTPGPERTIDITTYGAKSGQPRRLETWLYRAGDKWLLSGAPGPRDWYANLKKNPELVVHLKKDVVADLPATARLIEDDSERKPIFEEVLAGLKIVNPNAEPGRYNLQPWMDGAPLVELTFHS